MHPRSCVPLRATLALAVSALSAACGTSPAPGDGGAALDVAPATDGALDVASPPDGPGGPDAPARDAAAGDDGAAFPGDWLVVRGNRIVHGDGRAFHGRGANLHDERSCEACSFAPRVPAGVDRWSDELINNWHANFIRFLLASKAAPYNMYEQQWQSLVDDAAYYQDVQSNVAHMTAHAGVYVLVTLFADPTIKDENADYDSEWPGSLGDTDARYRLLAEAFYANPQVLFGLTNEPHTTADHDAELATRYQSAIATIRAVEDAHHAPHHIVVVQAPEGWSRDLTYFVAHPLPGDNIAYEVHPYNPATDFDRLIVQPARTLPVVIGEYGPENMTDADIRALWTTAQANEVPYIAWNFHMRCPPNLLQDTASDGCGLAASTGYAFPRTAWGDMLHDHLATPW
jgi:hypothetical protein